MVDFLRNILQNSKPTAYLVSPAMFENLLERIEDLEDQVDMQSALIDYHEGKTVDAEEVFKRKVARRSEKVYQDMSVAYIGT